MTPAATGMTVNGFLAGLVAVTCPCYWVSPLGAILIGAIARVVAKQAPSWVIDAKPFDQIDRQRDHGADNSPAAVVTGLFYGGGSAQLVAQVIGSAAVTAATFTAGMALMYAVKATGTLRVSKDGELEGLDLHEHGGHAYPELLGGVHAPHESPVSAPGRATAGAMMGAAVK